jgi:hypothetical protein
VNLFKKSCKRSFKHAVGIALLCTVGALLYSFTCKVAEFHYLNGYNIGRVSSFAEVIDHTGGFGETAASETTMSLLYDIRGSGAFSYILLESLYRTQQLDLKNISWENPSSLDNFDPTKLDQLVLDAAGNLSDVELEFYLSTKIKSIGSKRAEIDSKQIQRDAYYYALGLKTNFTSYEIELIDQCVDRLSEKFSNRLFKILRTKDSGGCNDIFYTLMKSYETRIKSAGDSLE